MEAVDCEYICLSLRLVRFVPAASATGEGDDAVVAASVCGVGCVCFVMLVTMARAAMTMAVLRHHFHYSPYCFSFASYEYGPVSHSHFDA